MVRRSESQGYHQWESVGFDVRFNQLSMEPGELFLGHKMTQASNVPVASVSNRQISRVGRPITLAGEESGKDGRTAKGNREWRIDIFDKSVVVSCCQAEVCRLNVARKTRLRTRSRTDHEPARLKHPAIIYK